MVYFFLILVYNIRMVLIPLILRILSNPTANVFQKKLTKNFGSFFVNFITYGGLSLCMVPVILKLNFSGLPVEIWKYAITGGLFGALGNAFLVKALSLGDLSVLGPINSYKSVVAMIFGVFLLGEIPSIIGILAIGLIIWGSYFIFDTVEEKFSLRLLKRKDIIYRILALIFTALEALMIKQVIILSDVMTSFILWAVFGFIFSGLFMLLKQEKLKLPDKKSSLQFIGLISMFGLMQITTNYVFENMNVSYALALFQLSSLINVIFGYKFFKEKHLIKKLIGTTIMIIGAVVIILGRG